MTRIKIKKISWDKYNVLHIQKHNVSPEEVEKAGKNFIYHRRTKKERYLAVSRVESRIITVIVKSLGKGSYYVVTARDADKKERRTLYEIEKNKKQDSGL